MTRKNRSEFAEVKALAAAGDWTGLRAKALSALKREFGARSKAFKFAQGSFLGLELEVGPKLARLIESKNDQVTRLVLEYTIEIDRVVAVAELYHGSHDATREELLEEIDLFDSVQFETVVAALDESGGPEHLIGNLILSAIGSALARERVPAISVSFSHHDVTPEEVVEFQSGVGEPIAHDLEAIGIDDMELMALVVNNRDPMALKAKFDARDSLSDLVKRLLDPFLRDRLLRSINELGESRRLDRTLLLALLKDGNYQVVEILIEHTAASPAAEKEVMKHFVRLLADPSTSQFVTKPLIESRELGVRFVPSLLSILPNADEFTVSTVVDTLFKIDDSAESYRARLLELIEGSDLILGRVISCALNLQPGSRALLKNGEPLLQYLDHHDWFVRQRILDLCAKLPTIPVSLEAISTKLDDSEPKVRIAAGCLVAKRFGVDSSTIQLLRGLMRDSDLVVGNVISDIARADTAGLLRKEIEELRQTSNAWLAKRVARALEGAS